MWHRASHSELLLTPTVVSESPHLGLSTRYAAYHILVRSNCDSADSIWALPSGKMGFIVLDIGTVMDLTRVLLRNTGQFNLAVEAAK